MSVFLDTGLWYALQNQRAQRHGEARSALSAVLGGRYGRAYTSDYVYDETVALVRSRTGSYAEAKTVGDRIRGVGEFPAAAELLYVSEEAFTRSVDVFERYRDHPLSFTDATTVALMGEHDVDSLLSFDDDFDGVVIVSTRTVSSPPLRPRARFHRHRLHE